MPSIIMTAGANKLDGAVKGLAYSFLSKLSQDDALPGLHIEPIQNVQDDRVRTGRVNDNFRAVLFKLSGIGGDATYVYVGTWPHDEAISRAQSATLTVNPVNGIPEVSTAQVVAPVSVAAPESQLTSPPLETATPLLVSQGVSLTDLTMELGIDQHVAELAIAAPSASEIYALADQAVVWQGVALLDLVAGDSIAEVKDRLDLQRREPTARDATDEEIIEAFREPAAQLQFSFIEDNDELKRVIDSGDLGAWRLFLHPEQRRYATASYNGAFRLSGGAGTGKTVVLIHRARELAKRNPEASILLTTYTTTLADALRDDLRRLDPTVMIAASAGTPGVYVAGVDAAAARILRNVGDAQRQSATEAVLGHRSLEIKNATANDAWRNIAESQGAGSTQVIGAAAFLQAEYTMVVLPHRIRTRDEYMGVRRPGRGVRLDRSARDDVWKAVESYRASASVDDSTDWSEKAAIAAAALEGTGPIFDHVLVDEAQDLTPSQWQFLRGLVAPGPDDLFVAEDSHQRIYGHPVVLSRYGINIVGRSRRLTLNYRTTAENLALAMGVLEGQDYTDIEGEPETTTKYRSARRGPEPQLLSTASVSEELQLAHEIVGEWLHRHTPEAIGILVRDKNKASQVVTGLSERGIDARLVESKSVPSGKPIVMTMHRAKGMEFEAVLIFGVGAADLPAGYLAKNLSEADRKDFLMRERSLLYVSATRARDELVILWEGEPSELLPSRKAGEDS